MSGMANAADGGNMLVCGVQVNLGRRPFHKLVARCPTSGDPFFREEHHLEHCMQQASLVPYTGSNGPGAYYGIVVTTFPLASGSYNNL